MYYKNNFKLNMFILRTMYSIYTVQLQSIVTAFVNLLM